MYRPGGVYNSYICQQNEEELESFKCLGPATKQTIKYRFKNVTIVPILLRILTTNLEKKSISKINFFFLFNNRQSSSHFFFIN